MMHVNAEEAILEQFFVGRGRGVYVVTVVNPPHFERYLGHGPLVLSESGLMFMRDAGSTTLNKKAARRAVAGQP